MQKLRILILIPILPIVIGKFNLVIKQVINNEEVALNGSQLTACVGDYLQFNCYLYLTFRNNSFVQGNVEWQTPFYGNNVQKNGSSIVIIPQTDWTNDGQYTCVAKKHLLFKSFYLTVHDPHDAEIMKIVNDGLFNFTDIKIPNVYYDVSSYTDKGPIFFVPAVIVIILGIVRMCYYLRNRTNVSWERLRTATCNHHLCVHRRRADSSAPCLLQSSLSSRLSVVIVGRVSESGIDNPVSERDGPPAYNEVIPQDLPPTYTEAVENSTETPSESRT